MGTVIKKATNKKEIKSIENNKGYRPMIRSRHPSHNGFRNILKKMPFRSVIRFGSLTELDDEASKKGNRIELNSIEAIKNSSNKLKMKKCFTELGVATANWIEPKTFEEVKNWAQDRYPIVSKSHHGSRGTGNTLIKNSKELDEFFKHKNINNYIFEQYCNFNKEYRLHVTKEGCFYTCRKMLKQEFKDHPNAWQRHDDNCVWILESNPMFEKPDNWNKIVEHCVLALKACGLDFGACDLRVQNSIDKDGKKRNNPEFIVVEINSAPSMGTITLEKYKEKLPELLMFKYNERN